MNDNLVEVTERFSVMGSVNAVGADVTFQGGPATVEILDPDGQ